MEKVKYILEKYKIIIFVIISVLILLLSLMFKIQLKSEEKVEVVSTLNLTEEVNNMKLKEEINKEKFKVDIKGLVEYPGVYELSENARVIDVITSAGGLKEGANTEYINLSKKITDEMVIVIYSNNDVEKFKEIDKEIIYIEYECVCPDNINDACINESDTVNTNGTKEEMEENDNLISINKGSLEELMTLNGIGESKAKAIIEYREKKGEFKSLEELMNVSGIGESAYSKIKDNIKL